jgi:hypothetical protein
MNRPWFNAEMSRLAGLKFPPAELDTHWEALNDIPEDLLTVAINRAQRESDDFPAPKMLRMYADQARRSTAQPVDEDRSTPLAEPYEIKVQNLRLRVEREWHYYCDKCSDLGMRSFTCGVEMVTRDGQQFPRAPWLTPAPCGRKHQDGYAHEWAEPCACAATNPAVLKKKDRASRSERRDAA